MKDRYINSQLTSIKEKKDENNKLKSNIDLTAGLIIATLTIFTVSAAFAFPSFALSSGICLGASIVAKKKYKQIYSDRIKRLENEEEHLENLSKESPDVSTELNKKRIKKIRSLKNVKKDTESSYETSKSINGLVKVVETTGVVLSFVNPWFSLIGFTGLAIDTINSKNMIKKNKENETIENRINNLENDLQVIINDERDNQGQRISNRKIMNPSSNIKQNTKTLSNHNQQAVNNYVNNLANQNQTQNPVQKRKK